MEHFLGADTKLNKAVAVVIQINMLTHQVSNNKKAPNVEHLKEMT